MIEKRSLYTMYYQSILIHSLFSIVLSVLYVTFKGHQFFLGPYTVPRFLNVQ